MTSGEMAAPLHTTIRSATREFVIGSDRPFCIIGERLNPTGRRIFQDQIKAGRTVVTLGIPDVVVVDTADALLVTTRERVQDVKGIVALLQSSGREDLT